MKWQFSYFMLGDLDDIYPQSSKCQSMIYMIRPCQKIVAGKKLTSLFTLVLKGNVCL